MPSGGHTTADSKAIDLAAGLLAGDARYGRESNLVADLALLLDRIGIESEEIEREHPSGRGRIDLYIPRYRAIFEAKAAGKAADPDRKPAGLDESPKEQLRRYVKAEVDTERDCPSLDGGSPSFRRWTGIVTDGRHWHVYSYPHDQDPIARERTLHPQVEPDDAKDLVRKLSAWLEGDPVGQQWIPADPSSLFEERAKDLSRLYKEIPDSARRATETKRALWHDMLRVSGMSPGGQAAPERLFVTHSFLIAIARMVTHSAVRRTADWKPALSEGFASWILDWREGELWAGSLWEIISRYDWRRRHGDVLRSLYETAVSERDRKVFGEFYTPDWLAAMIVSEALDGRWLKTAIQKAEDAVRNGTPLRGTGVLDPACGSGTFLYHAARRLLDAAAMEGLQPTQKADVVAALLHGIDVHPVAVEIARANLMRVLPAEPSAGESALRVHLGDSLLIGEDRESLFGHVEGSMRLLTPRDQEILIPVEFVRQDGFADSMRRIVGAAIAGREVPPAVLSQVEESRREALKRCRDDLAAVIGEEGNSVWTWYAINIAAPHLLSERKVDRIVANPPWVKLAGIQEVERKRAMEGLGGRLGLQAGGKQSPHLDIAAFFVLRARELYLNDPARDPAIWLVKKSAIAAGHWGPFREKHEGVLAQSVDLEGLQPFGGGDARRCCLLMEHRRLRGDGPKQRQREHSDPAPRLEARLLARPGVGKPTKPKAQESWLAVRPRIQFQRAPDPLPQASSEYGTKPFRQGSTVVPHVLLIAKRASPQARGRVRVRTKESTKRPWRGIPAQNVEIPKRWLSKLYCSPDMLPFVAALDDTRAIIPVDEEGELDLGSAMDEFAWKRLDGIYRRHKGKGKSTPKTLAAQIDFAGKLSSQVQPTTDDKRMVLYPSSGDNMRAARTRAGFGFADSGLFWHVAPTEREAGYLTAVLNAPCLRRAFAQSRESGRHFQLHIWRKVPVPRYDERNRLHAKLSELCGDAEKAALEAARAIRESVPSAKQKKLSAGIRDWLQRAGISGDIDGAVRQLLPGQAAEPAERGGAAPLLE